MTQLTDKYLVYDVPDKCHSPYIVNSANGNRQGLFFKQEGNPSPPYVVLPPGSYRFLFTTKAATEEDARKVVRSSDWHFPDKHIRFVDYKHPFDRENKQRWGEGFGTALESLASLLRSKGLDEKNNFAIIEKNNERL